MSFDQMSRTPHSLTMLKRGAGRTGTAYTQAVQDFLHPQSLVPVVALDYNESLEDFSFLPSG